MVLADKIGRIEKLQTQEHITTMIGKDIMTYVSAFAEANIDVTIGLSEATIAMKAGRVTLVTDDLSKMPKLLRISKNTLKIIKPIPKTKLHIACKQERTANS